MDVGDNMLVKFIEDLEKEAAEEANAHLVYEELTNRALTLGYPATSNILRYIAADEERHNRELRYTIVTLKQSSSISCETYTHRLFPKTYADWANLGIDIKERDPENAEIVNTALQSIYDETYRGDNAKRFLVRGAGELGIK